ncbi:hypothetical protein ACQPZJ_44750 [Actinoplanes sp. CA-054009]
MTLFARTAAPAAGPAVAAAVSPAPGKAGLAELRWHPPHRRLAALPTVVRRARRLARRDQNLAAWRLLTVALDGVDPDAAPTCRPLINAILAYLDLAVYAIPERLASSAGSDEVMLAWSVYAYRNAERYGRHDDCWQHAARTHAVVLSGQGLHDDAVTVYRALHTAYRQLGLARDAVRVRRQLSQALLAGGRCDDAHHEIRAALHESVGSPDSANLPVAFLLQTLIQQLACCGHAEQAQRVLAEHGHLFGPPGSADLDARIGVTALGLPELATAHQPICQYRHDHTAERRPASMRGWYALLTAAPDQPRDVREPTPETGAGSAAGDRSAVPHARKADRR